MALVRFTERGIPDPIKDSCVVFFDDFVDEWALTSSEPVTGTSPWIGTALSSGTTAFSTDVVGGHCILSGAATTDNSGSQITQDVETFALQTNKDMYFGCRLKTNEATDNRFWAGFSVIHTALVDGADGTSALTANMTASIGFFKPDDSAVLSLTAKTGASTFAGTYAVKTLTADTWYVLEFIVKGESTSGVATIEIFVDGAWVGRTRFTGLSTTEMAVTAASVSGTNTGTLTTTFDWICGACER